MSVLPMLLLLTACAATTSSDSSPAPDDSSPVDSEDTAPAYFDPYSLEVAWMTTLDADGNLAPFALAEAPDSVYDPVLVLYLLDREAFDSGERSAEHVCTVYFDALGAERDDTSLTLYSDAQWAWSLPHNADVYRTAGPCDQLDPAIYRDSVEEWAGYHTWTIGLGPLTASCKNLTSQLESSSTATEYAGQIQAGYLRSSFIEDYLAADLHGTACVDAAIAFSVAADGVTQADGLDVGDGSELLLPQFNLGQDVRLGVGLHPE